MIENLRNQEEVELLMEQNAERYPILCEEINDAVSEIAEIVVKYEPLPLLNRAYKKMAVAHINKKTESEFSPDENRTQQWLIYLQNVITSNPPDENQVEDIEEEEYIRLSELFATMYEKTQIEYNLCYTAKQKKDGKFDEDIDAISLSAQAYYNGISGKQYPHLQPEILYKLLSPHDAIMQELFGIKARDFVEDIEKIYISLTRGIGHACYELSEKYGIDDEIIMNLLGGVFNEYDFPPQSAEILEKIQGNDLFDLQKITNLPIKLLEALSLSAGEDQKFMDKNEPYAGWTFKRYPSRLKPFIKVDGRYYCFHLHNLTDNIYRALNKVILNAKPSYKDDWQKKQGNIVEEYAFELFSRLLPDAEIFRNIKYKWYPNEHESKKTPCEADGIIIFDDNLFIVEVRGGSFSPYSPTTDFEGYQKSVKNLIEKPYTQGRRLYEYLKKSEGEASISDDKGNHLIDIYLSDYRRVTICCVTLEQLTDLGGQLSKLNKIGTDIDIVKHSVWLISIDDLRIYADLIQSPLVFCHYLEERNDALTKLGNLSIADEIDHYGIYLENIKYARHFSTHEEFHWIQPFAFRDKIDTYYYYLQIGAQVSPPLPKMLPLIKQIIEIADYQKKPGRCKMVGALLDLTLEEQNGFSDIITDVLIHQKTFGEKRIITFSGSANIVAICEQDGVEAGTRKNIEEQALAYMVRTDSDHIHLIEFKFTENCDVYDVDYTFLGRKDINMFNREMIEEIAKAQASKRLATKRKIGRNEPCPCGSGKKYKKCHGR